MSGETIRQWPDNITSGDIRYDPSGHFEGGFILRDADHGIPVFGSVNVQVFNYPGQTEDIAKALCDRWNSYASSQAEIERLRDFIQSIKTYGYLANIPVDQGWGSSGKKPASKDVWCFPRHMLNDLDAALSGSKD